MHTTTQKRELERSLYVAVQKAPIRFQFREHIQTCKMCNVQCTIEGAPESTPEAVPMDAISELNRDVQEGVSEVALELQLWLHLLLHSLLHESAQNNVSNGGFDEFDAWLKVGLSPSKRNCFI